ncbi:trypsin-like peptidase domain-containing protein [Thermomonospora umbrina]|uniref:Trypsin-like peptidase n=1 Tax=Thermomonospora umbrina TaxID=111806 RepID=A0A3D9SSL3_9ACTN|nr:trypsin-like peptidase domain-containing protein [Thermomonospora umbrina]REE97470.1 trypsin-like peptidase [Thermomonospora umbrina]
MSGPAWPRPSWQARIEIGGHPQGAGILVDREHVLTCAHLVGEHTEAQVSFPNAPQRYHGRKARVRHRGPWRRSDDPGDVAVLRLDEPVEVPPAVFAAPDHRPPHDRTLLVYGFPKGKPNGSYAKVIADFAQELPEGVQVESAAGHLERLQKGFSGGAVFDRDTRAVVGMITDAAKDSAIGRMMPVDLIRRHWEPLDELLPLTWLDPAGVGRLRGIVAGAGPHVPVEEMFARLFPGVWKGRDLVSVWDAIRYVAEECVEESALTRFLVELAGRLDGPAAGALRGWVREHLPEPAAPDAEGTASVIVKVENLRERDRYRVTLFSLIDGAVGGSRPPVEVGRDEVRAHVEGEIDALIGTVTGWDPVIEFVLPESWLCEPVEEWSLYPDEDEPIGAYHPVVVRDLGRMKVGSRQTRAFTRWQAAERAGAWTPEPIGCRLPDDRGLRNKLAGRRDLGALAYAGLPGEARLRVALNHGMPVMLWPRHTCTDAEHEGCPGDRFLAGLAEEFEDVRPERLPGQVMRLRAQSQEGHYGQSLTMFWDDPRRIPPPLFMET